MRKEGNKNGSLPFTALLLFIVLSLLRLHLRKRQRKCPLFFFGKFLGLRRNLNKNAVEKRGIFECAFASLACTVFAATAAGGVSALRKFSPITLKATKWCEFALRPQGVERGREKKESPRERVRKERESSNPSEVTSTGIETRARTMCCAMQGREIMFLSNLNAKTSARPSYRNSIYREELCKLD